MPRTKIEEFPADLDRDRAFQNVETLFEGMQVRLNDAAGVQEANAHPHVDRTHAAIDVGDSAEAGTVRFIKRGRASRGSVDSGNVMHALCEAYQNCKRRVTPASIYDNVPA